MWLNDADMTEISIQPVGTTLRSPEFCAAKKLADTAPKLFDALADCVDVLMTKTHPFGTAHAEVLFSAVSALRAAGWRET